MPTSSWDDTQPRSPHPNSPRFPRDIPPGLARVIISYARVIVRMSPDRAEVAVRAMEATVTEWRNGGMNERRKTG
jgi:hypothetical protein